MYAGNLFRRRLRRLAAVERCEIRMVQSGEDGFETFGTLRMTGARIVAEAVRVG
jgi:hypothetical protein